MPILPDQNDVVGSGAGNDTNCSGMDNDLARTFVPGRFDHAVLAHLNVTAFVGGACTEDFGFTHRCQGGANSAIYDSATFRM